MPLYINYNTDQWKQDKSYYLRRFNFLNNTRINKAIYCHPSEINLEDAEGIVWNPDTDEDILKEARARKIPCMFYTKDLGIIDDYISRIKDTHPRHWSREANVGYEVTSIGDDRFSPWYLFSSGTNFEKHWQLHVKGGKLLGFKSAREMKGKPAYFVDIPDEPWTRESVASDPESLYIFTDNLERKSGHCKFSSGRYFEKFAVGRDTLYHPTTTQACIRGLDNAYPITTMMDDRQTQITDKDLGTLNLIWEYEVKSILKAYRSGKYKRVVCSPRIFGDGRYSKLKTECPIGYKILSEKLLRLGIDNYGNSVKSNYPVIDLVQEFEEEYTECILQYPELILELIYLTQNRTTLTDKFATSDISQARVLCRLLNKLLIY